jgi:2-polyprenyl-3-methyl-5-hydroxy-6-metoxy-1,4-benzoquinol methylase
VSSSSEWLAAGWRFVRDQLPAAPATVLEIGCGPLGGFVPACIDAGYDAIGVDPSAPEGSPYRRTTFEELDEPRRFDAIVASASLHHVDDLDDVLDRAKAMLVPGGTIVVVEWV